MKKIFFSSVGKFIAIFFLLINLHSCVKKEEYTVPDEHCRTCKAVRDGVELQTYNACSTDDEAGFRNAYPDASVTCQ